MAKIPNSVGIFGPVAPNDSADTYATHLEEYGQGGYRSVNSISERNAIPANRRKVGMLVNVVGDKIYQLVGGTSNSNWQEFVTGGEVDPAQIQSAVNTALQSEVPTIASDVVDAKINELISVENDYYEQCSAEDEGALKIVALAKQPKNLLVYDPETWEEWSLDDGAVGDETGLEFTANGSTAVTATLPIRAKPSITYVLLYEVVYSDFTSSDGFTISTTSAFDLSGGELNLNKAVGAYKKTMPTKTTITANQIRIVVGSSVSSGKKIKIKNLRLFELLDGTEFANDFPNLTGSQLNIKYPFDPDYNVEKYPDSLIPYNKITWEEWELGSGAVADETGLEFIADGVNPSIATIPVDAKPNVSYGMLFEVVSASAFGSSENLVLSSNGAFDSPSSVNLNRTVGKYKKTLVGKSTITANQLRLVLGSNVAAGKRIKIKDIRIFEIVEGTAFAEDYEEFTGEQLWDMYPFDDGIPKLKEGEINISDVTPVALGYEPKLGDYVRLVKAFTGDVELVKDYDVTVENLELGTISSGAPSSIETRARTPGYIELSRTDTLYVPDGYKMFAALYDERKNFYHSTHTIMGGFLKKIEPKFDGFAKVVVAKEDDSPIELSEAKFFVKRRLHVPNVFLRDMRDFILEEKFKAAMDSLECYIEVCVDDYIKENGMKIGADNKTRTEIKDWILNRNNFLYNGRLKQYGKYIVNSDNVPVPLQGVALFHIPNLVYRVHTYSTLKLLKYYGVNIIRLPIYMRTYTGSQYMYDGLCYGYDTHSAEIKACIQDIVAWCKELGIYVLIDWHVMTSDSSIVEYKTIAEEFFTWASTTFALDGNVMFEIANEPYNNTAASMHDYAQSLINIIQGNIPNAVIVMGHGSNGVGALYTMLQGIGKEGEVFISDHAYVYDETDALTKFQTNYGNDYPLFTSEWGNSDLSGNGKTNDTLAQQFINWHYENAIPNIAWKFTYRDSTTSLLIPNREAQIGDYFKNGFSFSDLTHNGNLYLTNFRYNAFRNYIERESVL